MDGDSEEFVNFLERVGDAEDALDIVVRASLRCSRPAAVGRRIVS
jgi:hypothetical protein